MTQRKRGGVIYASTCLQVEVSLKERAREAGINMSRVLRDALAAELEKIECEKGGVLAHSPSHRNQPDPSMEASR